MNLKAPKRGFKKEKHESLQNDDDLKSTPKNQRNPDIYIYDILTKKFLKKMDQM